MKRLLPVICLCFFCGPTNTRLRPSRRLARWCGVLLSLVAASSLLAGPVIIGGDDLDQHGNYSGGQNLLGWRYIERALASMYSAGCITRPNDGSIAMLGSTNSTTDGNGGAAIHYAAQALGNKTVTYYDGSAALTTFFSQLAAGTIQPAIICVPSLEGEVDNGIDGSEVQVLNANANVLADFVNTGGGLMAHVAAPAHTWATTLLPGLVITAGACNNAGAALTSAGQSAFSTLTAADISSGPCHATYTGNLNGLNVLALDGQGRNMIIGGGCNTRITQTNLIPCGAAVVTCFSGQNGMFNPNGPVLSVVDVRNPGGHGAVPGQNWIAPNYHGEFNGTPTWTHQNLGEVFGVTLGSASPPNIFVAATGIYPSTPPGGPSGPGAVYRIDGQTAIISCFAQLPNNGVGLGNICHDPLSGSFYVSNFEDGRIYRLPPNPQCNLPVVFYQVYDHGLQGRPLEGLSAIPDSGGSGVTTFGRCVWGVQVRDGRLYYAVWNNGIGANDVWSVALDASGSFLSLTARRELALPLYNNGPSMPVSDIAFAPDGRMLLAERTVSVSGGLVQSSAHQSRVLEFRGGGGAWTSVKQYYLGDNFFGNILANSSAGGVDYSCEGLIWATGDYLRSPPGIYGLAGISESGNTAANAASTSYLIDLNGVFGIQDKTYIGDVAVRRCCECFTVTNSSVYSRGSGTYAVTFYFRNQLGQPVSYVSFPELPSGVTATPDVVELTPAVADGALGCVMVTVTAPNNSPSKFCFRIALHTADFEECCSRVVCFEPPQKPTDYRNVTATAFSNGWQVCLTFINRSEFPVTRLDLQGSSCFSFTPYSYYFPSPVPPGENRKVCVLGVAGTPLICWNSVLYVTPRTASNVALETRKLYAPPCFEIKWRDPAPWHPITNGVVIHGPGIVVGPFSGTNLLVGNNTNLLGLVWYLDGVPAAVNFTDSLTATLNGLTPGEHTLTADLLDVSGGVGSPAPFTFVVAAAPAPAHAALIAGSLCFQLATEAGVTYFLEATDSLDPPTWLPVREMVGDGTVLTIKEPITTTPARFYRVRMQ